MSVKRLPVNTVNGWAERFGVGVDVAIHEPNREGDQRNHHAHILTTTRQIEGDELTSKTRELDEKKSGAVEEVREKWADLANVYLERIQHKERLGPPQPMNGKGAKKSPRSIWDRRRQPRSAAVRRPCAGTSTVL